MGITRDVITPEDEAKSSPEKETVAKFFNDAYSQSGQEAFKKHSGHGHHKHGSHSKHLPSMEITGGEDNTAALVNQWTATDNSAPTS